MTKCSGKTNIIRDVPNDSDLFDSKAHSKIACAISKIINNDEGGITIGLSGDYGSGKSTILNILRKKYEEPDSNTRFVNFDAWAHEGNLLRYVFLKKIINELEGSEDDKKGSWFHNNNLKDNVINRIENGQIEEISPDNEKLLTGLALYILLIPTLFSVLVDGLEKGIFFNLINPRYVLNIPFVLGITLLIIPLFYFVPKIKETKKNGKVISFVINRNLKEDKHQLSSVEYDDWFLKILDDTLQENKKLIIIIDNLERISKSRRDLFLSTLQTFLQYSQSVDNKYTSLLNNKLWVIIPFNPNIFPEDSSNSSDHVKIKDKRFQIIFNVPELFLSDWEKFIQEKLNEAFPDHKGTRELINIIYLFKEFYKYKPRLPREIVYSINQIGTLHRMWCPVYPLDHIAFFILYDNIKGMSLDKLLDPEAHGMSCKALFITKDLQRSILGLFYNTTYEKAAEIYLERTFEKSLSVGDYDTVSTAIKTFGEVAGTYLEKAMLDRSEKKFLFVELFNLWQALFQGNIIGISLPQKGDLFIDHIRQFLVNTKPQAQLDENISIKAGKLISFFSSNHAIKELIIRKINPTYNPDSDVGEKTLLEDVSSSVNAFINLAQVLEENRKSEERYLIVINSTEESFFNFLIGVYSKSKLKYVEYIDFYCRQQPKGVYDFSTIVKLSNFDTDPFTNDVLGAFKILDILTIKYDKLTLFQRLSTLLINEIGVPELTPTYLESSNNLLEALLYFHNEGDYWISQFITPLKAHQHGRIIRIFQKCIEVKQFNKAAQWLFVHFQCHPDKLEFPTQENNDYDKQFLKKFTQTETEDKPVIIKHLIDFLKTKDIDHKEWFDQIKISSENIAFIISLLEKFNEPDSLKMELPYTWIINNWNYIQSLPEPTINQFICLLIDKFDFESKIINSTLDFSQSQMYSKFIENSSTVSLFQHFKNTLGAIPESQWTGYFNPQHPIFYLLFALVNKIKYDGKDYFVINLKEEFLNAYSKHAIEFAAGNAVIDNFASQEWRKLYLALNRNYQSGCRYEVFLRLENLQGVYCDNFFEFYGELLSDADSLKRRETLIIGILLPLLKEENINHLKWVQEIFTTFGNKIISKNSEDDIIVFKDKLQSLSEKTINEDIKEITKNILKIIK